MIQISVLAVTVAKATLVMIADMPTPLRSCMMCRDTDGRNVHAYGMISGCVMTCTVQKANISFLYVRYAWNMPVG
jgi:hypothetical protein